jgi:cytidine deaminase
MNSLIQHAKDTIDKHYDKSAHRVAAAIRTELGQVFTSVSVQGQKMHLCSEWSAFVQALMSESVIVEAVAVYRNPDGGYVIYPPCGLCRELYVTYCPEAKIILGKDEVVSAKELLPKAWTRK